MYDVIFEDVFVVDGTNTPGYRADVAIEGQYIRAIGKDLSKTETSGHTIEGNGRILSPGFIDIHTHSDFTLLVDPRAESKIRQGTTTEVIGNCGGWAAPLAGESLKKAQEQLDSFGYEDEIRWRNFSEYLQILREVGPDLNVAGLVGHGAIRATVMGYSGDAPSDAHLREMEYHLREALEAGAFGMSTGIYYAPGSYATRDELIYLSEIVAEYGGLHSSHIRDESNYSVGLISAMDEIIEIAQKSGVSLQISHLKALGPYVWGISQKLLEKIAVARARGIDVMADQYPYTASGSSITGALVPRWAQKGGRSALLTQLDNEESREKLLEAMRKNLQRRGGAERLVVASFDPDDELEGKTLAEIAKEKQRAPEEAAAEMLKQSDASFISFVMQPEDVQQIMQNEHVMIASDGRAVATDGPLNKGHPHPRYYGTFPRVLHEYGQKQGVVSLEEAVYKMTLMPARRLGLQDRGIIKPGMNADLVMFSPSEVRDAATFEKPKQYAEGIDLVMVNGQTVLQDGKRKTSSAGEILIANN